MKVTGERIFKEIQRMDKALKRDDPVFVDAVVLLDSSIVGPSADKIADHLGLPRSTVREIGKRAREYGLWVGDKVAAGDWFAKDGGIAFWLDVAVLRGMMTRVR